MIKRRFSVIFLFLCLSITVYSQIGIKTDVPKATLDVAAVATDATVTDGILIPRLTGDQLRAKDALYGPEQHGTLIYVTQEVTPPFTGKTRHVRFDGFYYYDRITEAWLKVNSDAYNGLSWDSYRTKLGGSLAEPTTISGLTAANTLTFQASNTASAFLSIRTADGSSGGLYFGNASHGITRGFPTLGIGNNVGLYTTSGHVFLSTDGKQTGEFILRDNGNVGIGLGNTGTDPNLPTAKLHVNAPTAGNGFRLQDGSQAEDKVLVSDASGNARWDFGHKAHLTVLTATNTTDVVVSKHPNRTTVPGLEGFIVPATGKYIIYYHSFLQANNTSGDKAFYFEVFQNGTMIKDPESYLYVSANRIMAVNVPVIINVNEGDQITFRWRDGLTSPSVANGGPQLTFREAHNTRNFIEILYMGR